MIYSSGIGVGDILGELVEKFSTYNQALNDYSKVLMNSEKVRKFIILANRKNMALGLRPDGSEIEKTPVLKQKSRKYEHYTIDRKREEGKEYNFVDLYDTGTFYNTLKVVAGSDNFYVKSDEKLKSDAIASIWGDVLGISQDDLQELIEVLRPDFIKFTRRYFLKNEGV